MARQTAKTITQQSRYSVSKPSQTNSLRHRMITGPGYWTVFYIALIVCVAFSSLASATEYEFEWSPSPATDNVEEYRVYYRSNSGNYAPGNSFFVNVSTPGFNPAAPTMLIDLPEIGEEYCFAATAMNTSGIEGFFSQEVGDGDTCGSFTGDAPTTTTTNAPSNTDAAAADEGGGCFLSTLCLF